MKRIMAAICIMALIVCSFMGCSSGNTSQTVASESEAPSETSQAPSETVSPEPSEPSQAEEEKQALEPTASISYPLAQRMAISVFCPQDSMAFMLMNQLGMEESWTSIPTLDYVYEKVNFEFEFISPGESAATEQFNLMIASGEWADMFESSLYTGGTSQALSDEIILDLTDLIPENMPDYGSLVQQQTAEDQANLYNDDQRILSINDIYGSRPVSSGLLMRKDMLDAVGLQSPVTTEQLYEALAAVKAQYDTPQTFYIDPDGILVNVVGAFGTAGFDVTGSTANPGFYVEDGTVKSALMGQGYYDYLQYFSRLYGEGLIYSDFYTQVRSASLMNSLSLGSAFIWNGDGGLIDSMTATGKQELESYQLCGLGPITLTDGDTYHFAAQNSMIENSGTCITSTCEDPDATLQVLNWYFTDEGRQFCTWGVEGLTYTSSSDGSEEFTENITNGVFAINPMYGFYIWSPSAVYVNRDNVNYSYSDTVISAYDLWSDCDSINTLPGLSLTTEESEQYTNIISDLCTYASERILSWILGEAELTEESWQQFGTELEGMGIDQCISIYQAAYERYLSRIA